MVISIRNMHEPAFMKTTYVSATFIQSNGKHETVRGEVGSSLMDLAVDNGVSGIQGQCGGGCTCTTCHCYIDEPWLSMSGDLDPDEREILEFVPERQLDSRLGCQVTIERPMSGIMVRVPQNSS